MEDSKTRKNGNDDICYYKVFLHEFLSNQPKNPFINGKIFDVLPSYFFSLTLWTFFLKDDFFICGLTSSFLAVPPLTVTSTLGTSVP